MNSLSLGRLRRRLGARLAPPQALFLGVDGVSGVDDAKPVAFADWCRAHPGEAVQITVSAQLLHELVCEPGLPLQDEAALQAYGRQQFGHYFGAAAKSWPVATWRVALADKTEQCGASALHGAAGLALQATAAEFEVSLRRVQPAWSTVLQGLAARHAEWFETPKAVLAWVEGRVLTWLQLQDGRPVVLRQLRLAAPTQAALAETLREQCAPGEAAHLASKIWLGGYGLDTGTLLEAMAWPGLQLLGRLDGRGPQLGSLEPQASAQVQGLPRPDFLGARVARSALAWPLLGLGVLALLGAVWSGLSNRAQLQQATQRQAELKQELRQSAGAPAPAAMPAKAAPMKAAELEQQRSAAEVQALLRQPWEALLSNVEQAGAEAAAPGAMDWLALDFNAARQDLRLEGLVQEKSAALALVDRLAAAPAWTNVVLSRFQTADQGLVGQRFDLSAKLRPSLLKRELAPLAASAASANQDGKE